MSGKASRRKRRAYSDELKAEAVQMLLGGPRAGAGGRGKFKKNLWPFSASRCRGAVPGDRSVRTGGSAGVRVVRNPGRQPVRLLRLASGRTPRGPAARRGALAPAGG